MVYKIKIGFSAFCGILALIIFIAALIQGEISFIGGCLGWFCTTCWAFIDLIDNIK